MQQVLDALAAHARRRGDALAITDTHRSVTFSELHRRVSDSAALFDELGARRVALLADNGIDWIVADLAAARCGACVVPVPPYFTAAQCRHLLETSAPDVIVADAALARGMPWRPAKDRQIGSLEILATDLPTVPEPLAACAKITFTSGSTGSPRGVRLSAELLDNVAARLADIFADAGITRHLCSVPLAMLLENVAGVYVPLLLGAEVAVPPLSLLGLYGSSRMDGHRFLQMIRSVSADSLILSPQVLRELTEATLASGVSPALRFVAVGGARVCSEDLVAARAAGIPAYQGYGLSECGSVVALNRPGCNQDESVGRPIPGVQIEIAPDGEILVRGQSASGYVGDAAVPDSSGFVATGDIGWMDDEGYLHVVGRKKNLFISAFGRNVSPEWPEAELLHEDGIVQACVFGEAMPSNTAVIAIDATRLSPDDVAAAVQRANGRLPDYARIANWCLAPEPFSPANGLLTANGKLRREAIADHYLEPGRTIANPDAGDHPLHRQGAQNVIL